MEFQVVEFFFWHTTQLQTPKQNVGQSSTVQVIPNMIFLCKSKSFMFPHVFCTPTLFPYLGHFFSRSALLLILSLRKNSFSFSKMILVVKSKIILNYSQISKLMWICNWIKKHNHISSVLYSWVLSRIVETILCWHVYNSKKSIVIYSL